MYDNRRYLIIPSSIVDDIDFSQVHETSGQTLRYSVDNTKTFVKYDVTIYEEDVISTNIDVETGEEIEVITPAGIYGRPSIYNEEYTEYTHEQILEILSGEDWTFPMPEFIGE
jgi:hypothetical protein